MRDGLRKKPPIPVRKQGDGRLSAKALGPLPFGHRIEAPRRRPRTGRFTYACFGFVMREWMMLVSSATPPKTVSAM